MKQNLQNSHTPIPGTDRPVDTADGFILDHRERVLYARLVVSTPQIGPGDEKPNVIKVRIEFQCLGSEFNRAGHVVGADEQRHQTRVDGIEFRVSGDRLFEGLDSILVQVECQPNLPQQIPRSRESGIFRHS